MKKSASEFYFGFLDFIDASPTQYHAVANLKKILLAGFREYDESEVWDVAPGSAGFVVEISPLWPFSRWEKTGFRQKRASDHGSATLTVLR